MPRTVAAFSRMGLSPKELSRAVRTSRAALTMVRTMVRTAGEADLVAGGADLLEAARAALEASAEAGEAEASVEVERVVVEVVAAAADGVMRRMRGPDIVSNSRRRSRIYSITSTRANSAGC